MSGLTNMTETSLSTDEVSKEPLVSSISRTKQKKKRICCMIVLVFGYCLAEIIVGYALNFLSLVADSFHMLSDSFALFIALYGITLSERPEGKSWRGKSNTFGWGRSEVVTTLINSVFLTALCITIFMDACKRLFDPQATENPATVCIVGLGGLLVNIIGIVMFWQPGHGHSHGCGGHGHSHSAPAKKKAHISESATQAVDISRASFNYALEIANQVEGHAHHHDQQDSNMRAVFLHVLADFLGSIVVILAAFTLYFVGIDRQMSVEKLASYNINSTNYNLIKVMSPDVDFKIHTCTFMDTESKKSYNSSNLFGCYELNESEKSLIYYEPAWVCYIDPVCSLMLVCFLLVLTLPLLKEPVMILLQSVPQNAHYDDLSKQILSINNVVDIHCFHVWEFTSQNYIASLHIVVDDMSKWMTTLTEIESIFKTRGTFNLTIQPESVSQKSPQTKSVISNGELAVLTEQQVDVTTCTMIENGCCSKKSMTKEHSKVSLTSK